MSREKVSKQAICGQCQPEFRITTTNGTNPLAHHLNSVHHIFKPLDRLKEENTKPAKKMKVACPNQQAIEQQLALFLGDCHLPLNLVEKESFRLFVKLLNPTFVIPSRNGVRDQIHHVAESVKDKIRGLTRNATYPVFCADLWKSKARDHYVAVTVQFIDPLWKLHNVPVGFVQIVGPHTNEAVGRMIHEILQPFLGPGVKPAGAVIDGGDIGAAAVVGKLFDVNKNWFKDQTCVCHQLNNIIKKIFCMPRNPKPKNSKKKIEEWQSESDSDDDEISNSEEENEVMNVEKLQDSANEPEKTAEPNILEDFLIPMRRFIKALRHSHPMREAWIENCNLFDGKPVEFQPDVATRWSSSVNMLRKALKHRTKLQMFLLRVNKDQLSLLPKWTDDQWELLENLMKVFGDSAHTFERLQAQKNVTQSSVLLELLMLEKNNKEIHDQLIQEDCSKDNSTLFLTKVVEEFQNQLNSLWNKLPIDSIIATFLDPRVKVLSQIPKNEHDEAVKTMARDFGVISKKHFEQQIQREVPSKDHKANLFKSFELVNAGARKPNQKKLFGNEWDIYKAGIPCPPEADPLDWWRRKETEFPVLAELAKLHLAIPASQASCERLFSIMKNDITDHRTRLDPFFSSRIVVYHLGEDA